MVKKNKPLPASATESLPLGTRVVVLRPNQWAGLEGVVETFGNGIHLVRVSYPKKPETFLVVASFEELRPLSETSDKSTPHSSSPRPS